MTILFILCKQRMQKSFRKRLIGLTTQNLKIFTINTLTKTSVRDHRLITLKYKVHFCKLIKTTIYKNEKEPQNVQASPTEDLYIANKNTKR